MPFASLSFHKTDTIRLLQFPEEIYLNLQHAILASWPLGIESDGPFGTTDGSYQFKLKGKPFGWLMNRESVGGARLVRDILAFIYHSNWETVMPLAYAERLSSKDLLIFRPRPPEAAPLLQMEWLALAPAKSDRLYVIGDSQPVFQAPRGMLAETNHVAWVTISLTQLLRESGVLQSAETKYNWVEYKLKGRPWSRGGEGGVKTRALLLRILHVLDQCGWTAHTTIQHRTGNDDRRMLDTIFFRRPKGLPSTTPPRSPPIQPLASGLPPYTRPK